MSDYILQLEDISKFFGPVIALNAARNATTAGSVSISGWRFRSSARRLLLGWWMSLERFMAAFGGWWPRWTRVNRVPVPSPGDRA